MKFDPDWVVAPGETLAEWFAFMHLPKSIARHYGISEETLEGVLAGETPITEDLASRIGAMTQIGFRMWLALEHNFRVGLAAGKTWSGAPQ